MPMYEYACRQCGNRFEKKQSFADAPIEICPSCGGQVKRVIHAAGIVFKGSGFYTTDYRSEGYKEAAKKESDAGSKSEKSDKSDKSDKSEVSDKTGKPALPGKSEKPAPVSESKPTVKPDAKPAKPARSKD